MATKDGDGSPLPGLSRWQGLWRGRFEIERDGVAYVIDVPYLDWDERITLYVDGAQREIRTSPARFDVAGGRIEAALSTFGAKRARFVGDDGERVRLTPAPGTAEHSRARFALAHPGWSRLIAVLAWLVLAVGLALSVPGWVESATGLAAQWGWLESAWTAPWRLPSPWDAVLSVLTLLAGLERALSLRHVPVLDS